MVSEPAIKNSQGSRRIGIAAVFAVIAIGGILYVSAITDIPITTKGEAREAIVVQAMVRDADYVLPMRNGNEIPSKPPLFHWLATAASALAGGVTPTTVRAVSVVAALVLLALTTLYAYRAWGSRVAVAAGIALLSMQQVMASATSARVDMLLAACVAAATFSGGRAVATGVRLPPTFFVAISMAVLTKGPIGYVLPIMSVGCYCLAARKRLPLAALNLRVAVPVLMLPLLWYGAAGFVGGERFVDTLLLKENYYRVVDPAAVAAGHVRPFWYYPPALLVAALPWSVFLIPALAAAWTQRGRLDAAGILFPLVWLATTVALFSLAGSKRAVYLLPCFPAVALLVGQWAASRNRPTATTRPIATMAAAYTIAGVFALAVVLIVAQAIGLPTFSWIEPLVGGKSDLANLASLAVEASAHRARLLGWAAIALALIGLSVAYARSTRWWSLFQSVAAFVIVTVAVAGLPLYRAMSQRQSVESFIAEFGKRVPSDEPLHFYQGFDYAVSFYMNRPVPNTDGLDSLAGRNRAWFFVWESSIDGLRGQVTALDRRAERVRYQVDARFDYHGNPRREALALVVVERGGERRRRTTSRHGQEG